MGIEEVKKTAEALDSCGCGDTCTTSITFKKLDAASSEAFGVQRFRIANMDCALEELEIRQVLEAVTGIQRLRFNLAARELTISATEPSLTEALTAIGKAGFKPEPVHAASGGVDANTTASSSLWPLWGKLICALTLATLAEVLAFAFPDVLLATGAGMALAFAAIALAGFSVYGKGLAALKHGRLSINALMSVAVTGAFAIGQWSEAAMVMSLYALAEAIEAHAVDSARNAIKNLLAFAPEQTEERQADGQWVVQLAKNVNVGAIIRIRPGERIALDGTVTLGTSEVDQSPVTGESLPVDKAVGDEVYAGTINQSGALEVKVTTLASNSTLARIIYAVEQAQSSRAPIQRFVDRFAVVYTPAVFVLAVAVFVLTPWLMEWTWVQSLYKALVLLVIACPCALVISTPVTVVSGLTAGARQGILIKGGIYLEEARKIKVVAMDKTGTITEGKPKLVAFELLDSDAELAMIQCFAKSLAERSDHPVSKAIAEGLTTNMLEVSDFKAMTGRGVQGQIEAQPYVLANHRWIEERGQSSPELEHRLELHEKAGRTVTILADANRAIALCAVADTIKPSSAQAIDELKSMGVTPVMLTGDNVATAQSVAAQTGIDEVHGNLLPEDKLAAIDELQKRVGITAMTGDGINDAPALAKANIGFAMGAVGTHTAMEAADIMVMNDDLRRLPQTIRLSKRTHLILCQNIALALGIKVVFLWLAVFDNASMWMAVFADMGASLLVVFNGLRLLSSRGSGRSLVLD